MKRRQMVFSFSSPLQHPLSPSLSFIQDTHGNTRISPPPSQPSPAHASNLVRDDAQDASWQARESAILALGAVAVGCHQGLMPFLEGMVSMLLPKLLDPRPMVRIISCWALSRYSHWLFTGEGEVGGQRSGGGKGGGIGQGC